MLVAAPSVPKDAHGWFTISTLTPFHGRLYWTIPSFTGDVSTDQIPGAIVSMPLGGGTPETVVATEWASAWDAKFVVDDEHVTFVDHDLLQAPRAGGDATKLFVGDEALYAVTSASGGGFLVAGDALAIVSSSGAGAVLSKDPNAKGTRKLVDAGDAYYGASVAGAFRVDGSALTILSTDAVYDIAVDDTWVWYTLDEAPEDGVFGARVPKAGGAVEYFHSTFALGNRFVLSEGIAQDDARVYFGDRGAISAVTKSTGAVTTTVAESQVDPKFAQTVAVAVDDDCVYWANADNAIWASPKH